MTEPQHMSALAKGQKIRLARAALRHRVTDAGDYMDCRRELARIIETDTDRPALGSMLVSDLVRWVPFMQPLGVDALLRFVGCSEFRLVRELAVPQLDRLADGLSMREQDLRRELQAAA